MLVPVVGTNISMPKMSISLKKKKKSKTRMTASVNSKCLQNLVLSCYYFFIVLFIIVLCFVFLCFGTVNLFALWSLPLECA